jgi:hypothetical protein
MVLHEFTPNFRSEVEIAHILHLALDAPWLVVFPLADPELREEADHLCDLSRLSYVGPCCPVFDAMSDCFEKRGSTAASGYATGPTITASRLSSSC